MRADRLFALLALLQERRRATAAELARELGVSERTVYRDLDALSAAGFPLVADRGRGGGCGILSGLSTHVAALSREEVEALALAGLPGPASELGLGALLAAGQRKLLAALPARVRDAAARAGQRFHLDPADWFRPAPAHPRLPDVARAVWEERVVVLDYVRSDGTALERRVAPLGLVLKAGLWYLAARAEGRARAGADVRAYRVSRIRALTTTDASFERDPGFDLATFWNTWSEAFEAGLPRVPVRVRLSPAAEADLHRLGDAARRAPPPTERPDAQGFRERTLVFEHLDHARRALLAFGSEVEVLAPQALRERMAAAARATAGVYGAAE